MNNDITTDTEFDPTIAMDFSDDPFVDEDAILDADGWDGRMTDGTFATFDADDAEDWEEDRNDADDIASAWGF